MSQERKNQAKNQPSREELLESGHQLFDELTASNSGIRGFSEATRGNAADVYSSKAAGNAFQHGLPEDIRRIGEIAEMFSQVKPSE